MTDVIGKDKERENYRRIAEEAVEMLKTASKLIDWICRGLETFQLYSEGHSQVVEISDKIIETIHRLFSNHRTITIDVGVRRFLVNGFPVYEASRAAVELHAGFQKSRIGGITFIEGVVSKDISSFMKILRDGLTNRRTRSWLSEHLLAEGIDKIAFESPLLEDITDGETPAMDDAGQDSSLVQGVMNSGLDENHFIDDPRKVYQIAVGFIKDILHNPNSPDQINIRDITRISENIVDNVGRFPHDWVALAVGRRIDQYSYIHPVNVAIFALHIAIPIFRNTQQFGELVRIALLYDVGKSNLPMELFTKPDALNVEEIETLHRHPIISADILDRHTDLEKLAVVVAYEHHLNEKKEGYPPPELLRETNLVTRIIRVAEAFDALINNDAYRQTLRPPQAIKTLMQEFHGTSEAVLCAQLAVAIGIVPPGSVVTLSNKKVGVVVKTQRENPARPIVRIVADEEGRLTAQGKIINLDDTCQITDVLPSGKVPFDPLEYFPFQSAQKSAAAKPGTV